MILATILAIDAGNSNTVLGLFRGRRLLKPWRIESSRGALLRFAKKHGRPVTGVIISSVVPSLRRTLIEMSGRFCPQRPLFVHSGLKMPIRIRTKNPREVGADRIVNAVAAYVKWGGPLIIVDLGTATTFDVVTARGDYIGGVIAPGLKTSAEALHQKCARLPKAPLKKPKRVIGRTTVEAMQSGLLFGYASMVDGMVERIKNELHADPKVIATGGLARLIASKYGSIRRVEPRLTLEGLRILYTENQRAIFKT